MGLTADTLDRLNRFGLLDIKTPYRMLELGCQNVYDQNFNNGRGLTYGMIAKDYFKNLNIDHTSWDITGCQCSEIVDLRIDVDVSKYGQFDVITDFGTTEHIENLEDKGFYEAFRNIHNLCKTNGYMIHETPLTGHWIGHGYNYVTEDFYLSLAKDMGYEILELTTHFCMGNFIDGCLVCCILKKVKK